MKKYLFIALVAFLAVTSASAQLRIKMGKNSPIEKLGRAFPPQSAPPPAADAG